MGAAPVQGAVGAMTTFAQHADSRKRYRLCYAQIPSQGHKEEKTRFHMSKHAVVLVDCPAAKTTTLSFALNDQTCLHPNNEAKRMVVCIVILIS